MTAIALLIGSASSALGQPKVRVVDIDAILTPVRSELHLLLETKEERRLGETNARGEFEGEVACAQGVRVRARPLSAGYFSKAAECGGEFPIVIKVARQRVIKNLQDNYVVFEKGGDSGKALHAYVEWVLRDPEQKGSTSEYYIKVYSLLGAALGVKDQAWAISPDSGEVMMTAEAKEQLEAFQKSNGITVTGKIDYETLSSLSTFSSGKLLYNSPPKK